MKKITCAILPFLATLSCFAQVTEPPSTPTNLVIDYLIGYLGCSSSTDNVQFIEYDM
ncbi:hypothetical protein [Kordia sp.]|uniref:hypothetical protein n=1 Tax=Kordia sp. TaxID=1965332 RepID=UPI0025BA3C80|nr:hypothetical protein [Kordia sp.]MCH2196619.1 hypothetical protein [Kordia sp.]